MRPEHYIFLKKIPTGPYIDSYDWADYDCFTYTVVLNKYMALYRYLNCNLCILIHFDNQISCFEAGTFDFDFTNFMLGPKLTEKTPNLIAKREEFLNAKKFLRRK